MRRRVEIPEGTTCPQCKSGNVKGHGSYWRVNRQGGNPPKIKIQLLQCKDCGKIFGDGEVRGKLEV